MRERVEGEGSRGTGLKTPSLWSRWEGGRLEGRLSCSPSPDPGRDPLRPVGSPLAQLPSVLTRGSSSASLHNSIIRSTIYHLMLHSLDPLGEGKQGLLTPACLPHAMPPLLLLERIWDLQMLLWARMRGQLSEKRVGS